MPDPHARENTQPDTQPDTRQSLPEGPLANVAARIRERIMDSIIRTFVFSRITKSRMKSVVTVAVENTESLEKQIADQTGLTVRDYMDRNFDEIFKHLATLYGLVRVSETEGFGAEEEVYMLPKDQACNCGYNSGTCIPIGEEAPESTLLLILTIVNFIAPLLYKWLVNRK